MLSTFLWTIGHSTIPIGKFVELLAAHEIQLLVDVRTVPRSRHNPQFDTVTLAKSLADAGLGYQHAAALGGLRKPRKDSINGGWTNAGFRGFADYMQTEHFRHAINKLSADGRTLRTVIMCAEAVPWRCHRSLIADALVTSGWKVRHIMARDKADTHRLTPFATIVCGKLVYPAPIDPTATPLLF
jgi:uncharacterized protein (DUF488 family)